MPCMKFVLFAFIRRNCLDQSTNVVSQLAASNPMNVPKKTPIIAEENENDPQSFPSSPVNTKPKISVERLSMPQVSKVQAMSNRNSIKVPSHVLTRRSPDSHKNLRAKTVRIGKIRWPPPLNPDEVDNANQQRFSLSFLERSSPIIHSISRRMLVQRRIQEEIHGNKSIAREISPSIDLKPIKKSSPVERKTPSGRRSQPKEPVVIDQRKKSPSINPSIDRASPLTDDGEMSTNEIVARNQPSRLDFHKTLTPMIGKENFELRKKLFEHSDDFSFTGEILICFSNSRSFSSFRCCSLSIE